jgi:hypothetical protein
VKPAEQDLVTAESRSKLHVAEFFSPSFSPLTAVVPPPR